MPRFRVLLSGLLLLLLTLPLAMPASAAVGISGTLVEVTGHWSGFDGEPLPEPALSAEEAIGVALTTFPGLRGKAVQGEPQLVPAGDGSAWLLNWEGDYRSGDPWVNIQVDGDSGLLLGYDAHPSTDGMGVALRYTREEAQPLAEEWFSRLLPESIRAGLRLVATPILRRNYGPVVHAFDWEHVVEGYPLAFGGAHIEIDAETGDLASFHHIPLAEEMEFSLPDQILTQVEAEVAFQKFLSPTLVYRYFHGSDPTSSGYRLVYQISEYGLPYIDQEGRERSHVRAEAETPPLAERMVPAAEKPYEPPAGPLTEGEAQALAQAVAGLETPPHDWYRDEGYPEGTRGPRHVFTWMAVGDPEMPKTAHVEIDAETGLLISFGHWVDYRGDEAPPPAEPTLTWEQAVDAAMAFMQEFRPDLAGRLALKLDPFNTAHPGPSMHPAYSVEFLLVHHGLEVLGRSVQIGVDGTTGKVTSAWLDHEALPAEPPALERVLSPEQVIGRVLDEADPQAVWQRFPDPVTEERLAPALVWKLSGLEQLAAVDAISGQLLDYEGRDLVEQNGPPTDIAGHPHERAIELFWSSGVLETSGGRFRPDEAVTAGEALTWLTQALGYRSCACSPMLAPAEGTPLAEALKTSPYASGLRSAVQRGIIKPEEFTGAAWLGAGISREEFALWLVRVLGHERVAQMPVSIPLTFTDADQIRPAYANAVAILAGLDIVNGHGDGRFQPQSSLSRGAAVGLIHRLAIQMRRS